MKSDKASIILGTSSMKAVQSLSLNSWTNPEWQGYVDEPILLIRKERVTEGRTEKSRDSCHLRKASSLSTGNTASAPFLTSRTAVPAGHHGPAGSNQKEGRRREVAGTDNLQTQFGTKRPEEVKSHLFSDTLCMLCLLQADNTGHLGRRPQLHKHCLARPASLSRKLSSLLHGLLPCCPRWLCSLTSSSRPVRRSSLCAHLYIFVHSMKPRDATFAPYICLHCYPCPLFLAKYPAFITTLLGRYKDGPGGFSSIFLVYHLVLSSKQLREACYQHFLFMDRDVKNREITELT